MAIWTLNQNSCCGKCSCGAWMIIDGSTGKISTTYYQQINNISNRKIVSKQCSDIYPFCKIFESVYLYSNNICQKGRPRPIGSWLIPRSDGSDTSAGRFQKSINYWWLICSSCIESGTDKLTGPIKTVTGCWWEKYHFKISCKCKKLFYSQKNLWSFFSESSVTKSC